MKKHCNLLTRPTKIVFMTWTIYAVYMQISGNTGVSFAKWLVIWLFGSVLFCGIAQAISLRVRQNAELKANRDAIKNIGCAVSACLKALYGIDVDLVFASEGVKDYTYTYRAGTKGQMDYIISHQRKIGEQIGMDMRVSAMYDSTFQVSVNKSAGPADPDMRTSAGPIDAYTDYDRMEGHDFESFCAEVLRRNGFKDVEVTRGSGDQGIDVIAYKDGIKYGIQCKCYTNDIGNKAVQEAYSGKAYYGCHVAAVMTNRYFTASAKELANRNGVLLWDRDCLNRMIADADSAPSR